MPSDTEEPTGIPEDLPFSAGIPPGHPEHREIDQEFIMNNEQRRKFRRMHNLTGSDTIFECACSENSILG